MHAAANRKGGGRSRRKRPPPPRRLPKDVLLHWPGVLPRFSSMLEGGPGRPVTLVILLVAALWIGRQGAQLTAARGMDSAGPALVLLSAALMLFLLLWLLIKALLRGRTVVFYLSERGVGIQPSARQATLDRRMRFISHLVFLATFKGGQWGAWQPFTPWKHIRGITVDGGKREILVTGGNWHIRLARAGECFDEACRIMRERAPRHVSIAVRAGKA